MSAVKTIQNSANVSEDILFRVTSTKNGLCTLEKLTAKFRVYRLIKQENGEIDYRNRAT